MKKLIKNLFSKFGIKVIRENHQVWGTDLFLDLNKLYSLNKFKIVFDVGANVGQSCILYSQKFKSSNIYSIEPVLSTFNQLKVNTKNISRANCINVALGNFKGELEIELQEKSTLNSLSESRKSDYLPNKVLEKIKVETLDNIIIDKGINEIDFLKIDTEGYEMEVLEGARDTIENGKVKFLLLELGIKEHERTTPYIKIHDYLTNSGYDVIGFYKQSQSLYTKSRFLMHCDVLFINREWSKSLRPSFVKSYEFD